jgi:carbonic anhydrase
MSEPASVPGPFRPASRFEIGWIAEPLRLKLFQEFEMRELSQLFANNRAWAARILAGDPEFFEKLSRQQTPRYFWIGCSDSRVPANEIVGLLPGELFVHRNIANIVPPGDLNCLSVLQFAVDVLQVRHVIVCGHYGCGGVRAVMRDDRLGLVDAWLDHVRHLRDKHAARLAALPDETRRFDRLCELNVVEQVASVCSTRCVRDAWERGQHVAVHGWIYAVSDGLLRDLGLCVTAPEELAPAYQAAVESGGCAAGQG